MNAEQTSDSVITRVHSIRLDNFRGFFQNANDPHKLMTDADIVLLTGPNGFGKTSLLEAILYLLTGWHGDRHPVRHLISQQHVGIGPGRYATAWRCKMKAEVKLDSKHADKYIISKSWNNDFPSDRLGLPDNAVVSPALPEAELNARLCGFFQDRVEELFDEAARGKTLLDVVAPSAPIISEVAARVERLPAEIAAERKAPQYQASSDAAVRETLDADLREAWTAAAPVLRRLSSLIADWPADLEIPEEIVDVRQLDTVAVRIIAHFGLGSRRPPDEELRQRLEMTVKGQLDHQRETARREATEVTSRTSELRGESEKIDDNLKRIAAEFPHLDDEIDRFTANTPGLPDALAVFDTLVENAHRWADRCGEAGQNLGVVPEEFGAVSATDAGKCAEILRNWLQPRREAFDLKSALRKRKQALAVDLASSYSSDRLREIDETEAAWKRVFPVLEEAWRQSHEDQDRIDRADSIRQAHDYLESAAKAAETCGRLLNNLRDEDARLTKEIMEHVRRSAGRILSRFSLVEGFLPLKLIPPDPAGSGEQRGYHVATDDGRKLAHFSTGQRAQVAVSLLVGQNLAVSDRLSHRILLLDDVTTAYDLSNLTREAIIWRQLAYGDGDPLYRRQIFISSHHEDMTNHLLDLLVPPPGKSMRLLKFVDWSNTTGPVIDNYIVDPSEKVDNEELADSLREF